MSSLGFVAVPGAPEACPGCASTHVRHYPPSRASHRSVIGCNDCGLRFWAERASYQHDMDDPDGALTFDYEGYVNGKREGTAQAGWHEAVAMLSSELAGRPDLSLYDVGAGDGEFLALAREAGFAVSGNELHAGAVEMAKANYDVDLQLGELSELGLENEYDAVTMWCVMAHVEDVDGLLTDCLRALKPGGILFLQTPRWSSVDTMALSALRLSGGRVNRIVDRRVAHHHWQLHTSPSMTAMLERLGYTDIQAIPKARYSLKSSMYLQSLGLPNGLAKVTGRAMDAAIQHGPVPRIVLDVFARKPL